MKSLPSYRLVRPLLDSAGTEHIEDAMTRVTTRLHATKSMATYDSHAHQLAVLADLLADSVATAQCQVTGQPDQSWLDGASRFISPFSSLLSLNYDQILYLTWVRFNTTISQSWTDGFGPSYLPDSGCMPFEGFFVASSRRRVVNLHGALFIRPDPSYGAIKVTRETAKTLTEGERMQLGNATRPSLAMICAVTRKRCPPLLVAGGTPSEKIRQIHESPYLEAAFSCLTQVSGNVLTYGWGLRDQDDHILQAIQDSSSLGTVFVGLYDRVDTAENRRISKKAQELERQCSSQPNGPDAVVFYSSNSAPVWGTSDDRYVGEEIPQFP